MRTILTATTGELTQFYDVGELPYRPMPDDVFKLVGATARVCKIIPTVWILYVQQVAIHCVIEYPHLSGEELQDHLRTHGWKDYT